MQCFRIFFSHWCNSLCLAYVIADFQYHPLLCGIKCMYKGFVQAVRGYNIFRTLIIWRHEVFEHVYMWSWHFLPLDFTFFPFRTIRVITFFLLARYKSYIFWVINCTGHDVLFPYGFFLLEKIVFTDHGLAIQKFTVIK